MRHYIRADIVDINDESPRVLEYIAYDPNTRPSTLARLAESEFYNVRCAVAQNRNTPEDVLRKLYEDNNYSVKLGLARNPSLPADMFERIANGIDDGLKRIIARNPGCPESTLAQLLGIYYCREEMAANPKLPVSIAYQLVQYPGYRLTYNLINNKSVPMDIRQKLVSEVNMKLKFIFAFNSDLYDYYEITDKLTLMAKPIFADVGISDFDIEMDEFVQDDDAFEDDDEGDNTFTELCIITDYIFDPELRSITLDRLYDALVSIDPDIEVFSDNIDVFEDKSS